VLLAYSSQHMLLQQLNALQNGNDKRPLHWAAQEGHLAVVKVLVKAGAEVDAQNRFDRTPLYLAAWYGHFEVTYWLWRRGANKYILDLWGEQAAFVSVEWIPLVLFIVVLIPLFCLFVATLGVSNTQGNCPLVE
jgi:hypothetical protein